MPANGFTLKEQENIIVKFYQGIKLSGEIFILLKKDQTTMNIPCLPTGRHEAMKRKIYSHEKIFYWVLIGKIFILVESN